MWPKLSAGLGDYDEIYKTAVCAKSCRDQYNQQPGCATISKWTSDSNWDAAKCSYDDGDSYDPMYN